MTSNKTITLLVPVFQNEMNLNITTEKLVELISKLCHSYSFTILYVNDGSTDASLNIIKTLQQKYPELISYLSLTRNFGQICALQAGLAHTTSDCCIMMSADLQDPPSLIHEMITYWSEGSSFVIAERKERQEKGISVIFSKLFWNLVSKYAVPGYPKGGFDFCLIDRKIIQLINQFHERNTHIFPLIFSFGFKPKIILYERRNRELGKSQWTLSKKIKLFLDTFIGFSYVPIRIISAFGFLVSLLSLSFGFMVIVSYFVIGNKFTGWSSLAFLISFIGGAILLALGIVAEYLWRTLDQVRKRPLYVIEESMTERALNKETVS